MRSNSDEKKLKAPLEVKLSHQNSYIEKTIRRDEFEMDDWMEHFNTIFNFRGIDSIKFDIYSEEYDLGDIKKYFGVPTSLDVEHTGNYAYNHTVLKTFVTVESLIITPDVFENSKIPPEILIQHFKSLTIDEFGHVDPKAVALDELFIINSKSVEIRDTWMGPKDINRFIKLWQHGANPRMECCRFYLKVRGGEEAKQEIILKGIKYTEIPRNVTRPFRFAGSEDECVRGGIDIWREDGVKATITSDCYWDCIIMFVWFDHCIV
ncbi:hypothetical protein CAEBREN_08952 [Caenorhabditis brenneri]|uniref:Sdz-33 F-box domain-containing protein n=1 Tax=Caenorhabditis brenneri TaxID=135651 RepID=G0N0I9_CAEBE|nr:hypothetical protein CAEBREN_08952 [Caenorhabditis brenneri]